MEQVTTSRNKREQLRWFKEKEKPLPYTKMQKEKTPYCLMPWIHLHVTNEGQVNACCVANINYGNLNEQDLEEIWNGEAIQAIRKKFAKGEIDKRCHHCIQREAAGAKSIRQETFENFPHINIHTTDTHLPRYFDIRFSNVCNFRCRTCWHGASSKWYQDAKILGIQIGEKAIIKNIHEFKAFIQKTGKALLQAEEIYFAGGEPLVTEEHYLLLEWLIKNKATKTRLRYNTNFSMLKFKDFDVLSLWKHFPKVEILASIDATGKLGEYIRKEMDWKTILENREKIRRLRHLSFKIAPTVSILNVLALPSLYQEAIRLDLIEPKYFYINLLEFPGYYNIQVMPDEKKEEVMATYSQFFEWCKKYNMPNNVLRQFNDVINYMNQATPKSGKNRVQLWQKFLNVTKQLDEIRKEKRRSSL